MADERTEDETPQGARRGGKLGRFFASKEGKLIGVGALVVALFFLVRYFGRQGQSAVDAAAGGLPQVDITPTLDTGSGGSGGGSGDGGGNGGGIGGGGTGGGGTGGGGTGGGIGSIFEGINNVVASSLPQFTAAAAASHTNATPASSIAGPTINQRVGRQYYHRPPTPPAAHDMIASRIAGPTMNQATARNYYHHAAPLAHPPHALAASIASTQHSQARAQHMAAAQRVRAGRGLIA